MFSQVSVCPRVGGCLPLVLGGVSATPPCADTPLGRHPPWEDIPWADTPLGRHPLGKHPPAQCMLGYTPPCRVHAGIHPPAQCKLGYGRQVGGTHPT